MPDVTISGTAEINSVRFAEQVSNPSTPASGYGQLYIKSDGVYFIDDAGTVLGPLVATSSGIGDVGAKVYHSADQTISNITNTILAWDSETYDTSTFHDTVTNNSRLTVPANGKYLAGCQLTWVANATGLRIVAIRKNGSTLVAYNSVSSAGAGAVTVQNLSMVLDLAAADYLEVRVYQDSSGNLAADTDNLSFFWIQRVA